MYGGNSLALGKLQPARAQRIEQARRAAGGAAGRALRAGRPRRARVVPQLHGVVAAQHAPRRRGQAQRAVAVDVDAEQAARDELADDRPPLARVEVGAGAEGRQPVMAEAPHALVVLAAQHVDDIAGAEPLAGPIDARQRLAGRLGRVP